MRSHRLTRPIKAVRGFPKEPASCVIPEIVLRTQAARMADDDRRCVVSCLTAHLLTLRTDPIHRLELGCGATHGLA